MALTGACSPTGTRDTHRTRAIGSARLRGRADGTITAVTFSEIDDVAELFSKAGVGNVPRVAEMLRYRPELARCRNRNGLPVLLFARYMGQTDVLRMLIDAGPPLDVFEAAAIDDGDGVRAALSLDPSGNAVFDANGRTALHLAAAYGSVAAIDALAAGGASLDSQSRDEHRQSPLHAAVERRQLEAARALLRHGCDPNAKQHGGLTALMIAASHNSREIAELLVTRNANVDVRNDGGKTASDIAAARGHLELAARLRLGERYIDRRIG